MPDVSKIVSEDLKWLRAQFQARGFDIRIVGGAVRDTMNGQVPNDVDFCTDASQVEQFALYEELRAEHPDFHYIATGVDHGTYTVIPTRGGEGYEITSLRTESQHDGRHAVVAYTKDWTEDLSRRDLTINAMALSFEGELFDPFNGLDDLKNNVVRFVGDAEERMTEDYLRILRYFRFLGRYSDEATAKATIPGEALYKTMNGLRDISAERIWSEMKKIVAHPSAVWVVPMMIYHSVMDVIEFPTSTNDFFELKAHDCTDPILLTVSLMYIRDAAAIDRIAKRLKWSNDEKKVASEISRYDSKPVYNMLLTQMVLHGRDRAATSKVAEFFNEGGWAADIEVYRIPVFPVTGDDLKAAGITPGPRMGAVMRSMKEVWWTNGAEPTRDDLIKLVAELV